MDILNNWSGFFALVAAIVSIASLCFGIWQYKKHKSKDFKKCKTNLKFLKVSHDTCLAFVIV